MESYTHPYLGPLHYLQHVTGGKHRGDPTLQDTLHPILQDTLQLQHYNCALQVTVLQFCTEVRITSLKHGFQDSLSGVDILDSFRMMNDLQ